VPAPLIGLTTSELRVPDAVATPAHESEPRRRDLALSLAYPGAVSLAAGAPVIVPPFLPESELEAILDRVDGVLVAGGPDIHPCMYGHADGGRLGPTDVPLDRFEIALVRRALERDLPVLGICRGAEVLNVARGGTLVQHIDGHRQSEEARVATHDVRVEEGSGLAAALGATRLAVNTFHHQAIDALGGGVRAVAWAGDGTVEGIELDGPEFALGVQWHAEGLVDHDEQRSLFRSFVAAATRYRSRVLRPRAA
jgi:putative glutamine amidotransferase